VADFLVNVYTQSGNQINVDNRAVRYADSQFWAMLRDTSPAMSHVEFNTTTGAEVRRELALASTVPLAFAYVGGLIITGESSTETLWAYDPDTNTAAWSTNCNSALAVTTPSVLAEGMNIVPSIDGTQVYVTRGGAYGGNSTPVISAFDVATGVELWEVDLSAAGWVGSGLGIYNGGVTVDKNGDVYVLCRVGTNGHIVRMTPAGAKVYVSSDQGITVAAGGSQQITCLAVSDTTGIVYVGTTNGQIHTVVQS
jgi:outer membrane protein assembly factor BamB